jgi:RNA polymerase sigma-70 factor (ECF subfamily)
MVVSDAIERALPMTRIEPAPADDPGSPVALARLERTAGFDEELVSHAPVLLAAARALVGNEADARDLAQTTLEIATRRAASLRDPAALRSWLLAIQVREAFRLRRRLARLVRLDARVVDVSTSSEATGPDGDVLALRAALAKLPPRARAAISLHYLADLPVAEVARAMGISENTAKEHLKTGLARLREELGDE